MDMCQSQYILIAQEFHCPVCGTMIPGDKYCRPEKNQLADLEAGISPYNPCLACGSLIDFPEKKSYRRKMAAHIVRLNKWGERQAKIIEKLLKTQQWPKRTKSLAGNLWFGECPACEESMALNEDDLWECRKCRLQICNGGGAVIMPLKGMRQYRFKERRFVLARTWLLDRNYGPVMIQSDQRTLLQTKNQET